MTTLDDRLRAAASEIEEIAAAAPLPRPETVEVRRPQARVSARMAAAVVAAAAVAVLVLVGGVVLLAGPGGDVEPPVGTEPVSTTVTPTTATTVTPTTATTVTPTTAVTVTEPTTDTSPPPEVTAPGAAWEPVDLGPGAPEGGFFSDVAAGGPGFVAVGNECGAGCSTVTGMAWVSGDGLAWARAESDTGFGNGLVAVTRGGPGLVAIGLDSGQDGPGVGIWVSDETGLVWQQAPPTAEFAGIGRVPVGVAANETRVVAVGTGMDESGVFGRVWVSDDGLAWTLATELSGVELLDVAAVGTGFVAFGNVVNESDDFAVAVWASEDGTEWTEVFRDDEAFGGQSAAIEGGDAGAIAVGGMPDTAWISPDGLAWTRAEGLTLTMETWAALVDEEAWVIVGRGAWWTSADGETWTRFDEPAFSGAVGAVARAADRLVAVGSDSTQTPTVWIGTVPGP